MKAILFKRLPWKPARKGFLLLVVIGLLALLLVVCVGFLVYSRQEVVSVAHIRDKAEASDLAQSAIDWTVACIAKDLFDASGQVRADAVISRTRNASDPCYRWWHKPMGPGDSAWHSAINAADESAWIYLPADYFPEGGVRGRYCVQVVDANAFLNLNDWTQDATPSQCQTAHMLMDGLGDQEMERLRALKAGLILPSPDPSFGAYPNKPERYRDCWRVVTRTVRHDFNGDLSPNWVTTNQSRFWCYDASNVFSVVKREESLPTSSGWGYPLGMASFIPRNYVDPDTGRAPVNVNTCFNSGESAPVNPWGGAASQTLEGVFNVESLRRIVKIGKFFSGGVEKDTANWAALTPAERQQVEDYKTKLAHLYQETLCRYFTATYGSRARYASFRRNPGAWGYGSVAGFSSANANYYDTYRPVLGGEVDRLSHAVKKFDFSETRFPAGVETFRRWVRDDLLVLSDNNRSSKYTGTSSDAEEFVGVDAGGVFEVAPGKLDKRTASAIYDNIVPGKAKLYPGHAKGRAVEDPLGELFALRWGRDERYDAQYNVHGFVSVDRGKDIVLDAAGVPDGPYEKVADVPDRQLVFGPDGFSTELTTASTTFILIVSAQIVDARSVVADPNKPKVLYNRHMGCVVELAPDLVVETPENYDGSKWPLGTGDTTVGLGYYRGGWPSKRLTSTDIMDKNCNTLHPDSGVSAAKEWIDYRNVPKGAEGGYYRGANQTKRRIFIRAVWDMNQRI